ncbi:MAG: YhjD/YihY/BrkB family envelope integrity protein, partial [Candidatus Limnocylindrales bacterium]
AFTDPVRRDEAVAAIATAVPGLATVARDGVIALASGGGLLSLVGLAGAAWAASNVYDVLDDAIGRVMPGGRARGLLHRRRRGLLAIALVAAAGLLVLSVRLALPIATLNIDGTVADVIFGVTEFAVGLSLLAVGVLAIYRFVPVAPPSVRAAALPALAAAVAIRLAAELFAALAPILVRNLQIFGVVVSLLALLVWLSWACRILLLGAAWAAVRRDRAAGLDSPAT